MKSSNQIHFMMFTILCLSLNLVYTTNTKSSQDYNFKPVSIGKI